MVGMNIITDRDRTKNTQTCAAETSSPLCEAHAKQSCATATNFTHAHQAVNHKNTRTGHQVVGCSTCASAVLRGYLFSCRDWKEPQYTTIVELQSTAPLSERSDRTEPLISQSILPGHLSGEQLKRHAATLSPCTKLTKRSPTESKQKLKTATRTWKPGTRKSPQNQDHGSLAAPRGNPKTQRVTGVAWKTLREPGKRDQHGPRSQEEHKNMLITSLPH